MLARLIFNIFRACLILLALAAILFVSYVIYREWGEFDEIKRKTNYGPNVPLQ